MTVLKGLGKLQETDLHAGHHLLQGGLLLIQHLKGRPWLPVSRQLWRLATTGLGKLMTQPIAELSSSHLGLHAQPNVASSPCVRPLQV